MLQYMVWTGRVVHIPDIFLTVRLEILGTNLKSFLNDDKTLQDPLYLPSQFKHKPIFHQYSSIAHQFFIATQHANQHKSICPH